MPNIEDATLLQHHVVRQTAALLSSMFSGDDEYGYDDILDFLTTKHVEKDPVRAHLSPSAPLRKATPAMTREEAYKIACHDLKYRCTKCTNPRFVLYPHVCPLQWKHGQFIDKCRYWHHPSERRPHPTSYEIDSRVESLMWRLP